jgi:hypothetical protein
MSEAYTKGGKAEEEPSCAAHGEDNREASRHLRRRQDYKLHHTEGLRRSQKCKLRRIGSLAQEPRVQAAPHPRLRQPAGLQAGLHGQRRVQKRNDDFMSCE